MADWTTIAGVLFALLCVYPVYIIFKSVDLGTGIVLGLMLAFFTYLGIKNYLYPDPGGQIRYDNIMPLPVSSNAETPASDTTYTSPIPDQLGGALRRWRRWFNEKKMSSGKLTGALFAVISALIYSVYRSAQTFLLLTSS